MDAAHPVSGPSWSAAAPDGALTAAAVAGRTGRYCWVEQQLFGLLGGWVAEIPELDVKALIAEQAEHAGWRAQRWFELLPSAPPGPDALVVAPAGLAGLAAEAHAVADGPERTAEKLVVAHRVLLPRLVAAYTAHLDWAPFTSESSARRMLAISLAELAGDLRHGERLLQALLPGGVVGSAASSAVSSVDDLVAAAGGLVGPGSVGRRPL